MSCAARSTPESSVSEGFQTVLRLGGNAVTELKRIVFQAPPRDD